MNNQERDFVNFNYVCGQQGFLKKANLVKYANEEAEALDANAITHAMGEEGLNAAEGLPEQKMEELANTIIELAAQDAGPEAGEIKNNAENIVHEVEEEKKAAEKVAEMIAAKSAAKTAGDDKTNTNPAQVLGNANKDYTVANSDANAKGTGNTELKTEKGEIGTLENKEHLIAVAKAPEANINHNSEGKDIYGKDYAAPGKGGTDLKTEKGEIGKQEPVESKLAKLALESTLARVLGK